VGIPNPLAQERSGQAGNTPEESPKHMNVEIVNPKVGGQWYTSAKKAAEYVQRGRAIIEDGMLRFLSREQIQANRMRVDYVDMTFWNGKDPNLFALHRPGEVVS
jgi:hypothetical protein